jgi:N-acetylmuramoyl-L-alanine amidase
MKINWKKTLQNVSFVILTLQLCVVFGQKKIIIIDPGHGGKDSGAIGINDIQEKDVILDIALEIIRLNKTLLEGKFDMYLTRNKDTLISLTDRGRLVRSLKPDVFVSLHCNASGTVSKGMEVYAHNSNKAYSKTSISLGLLILNEATQKLGFKKRGVKFANFQVLRETTAFCPAILVEMGFVTNIDEAGYFLKSKNVKAMALAILLGITNYLNIGL